MEKPERQNLSTKESGKPVSKNTILAVSVLMFVLIFLVTVSSFDFGIKLIVFIVILLFYAVLFWAFFPKQTIEQTKSFVEQTETETLEPHFDEDVENKLLALEEASLFFGASLKGNDMFRLITSRINEMIPFVATTLFLADETRTRLKVVFSGGENSEGFTNLEISANRGLAGKVFTFGSCQLDKYLVSDREAFPAKLLSDFDSAIAAPLNRNSETFGVLEFFGNEDKKFSESSLKLLEAVAERVAPLILGSLAFEKSLSNALTDSLTNLPNDRAFYVVLENQIAESQRYRDDRPLTVLTIDIKNFDEINQRYGHATGDNILFFASKIIKNQLRRMDFLARSLNDEFLTVLPTASEEITLEIIDRLKGIFEASPYEISPEEKIIVRLNSGTATFWQDGETPQDLLKTARLRKQKNKTADNGKIIEFPKGK